jgi:hypothetical protein
VSTLLRRELKRLAPYALGLVALAIVAALTLHLKAAKSADGTLTIFSASRVELWRITLVFVCILVPGVLAVGTVAPDTATGGTAFLARLPLSGGRVLSTKILAATILALVSGGLAFLAFGLVGPPMEADQRTAWVALTATALAGFSGAVALLASVVAPKTMHAILAAPAIGIGLIVAGVSFPVLAFEIVYRGNFLSIGTAVLALVLLAAAFAAYARGDVHRRSARPALIAIAGVVPALVLFVSGTYAAKAWASERSVPRLCVGPDVPLLSPDGHKLAVRLAGVTWAAPESRVAIVDVATGETWLLPTSDVHDPSFSPDGKKLLVRSTYYSGGFLVDLESRKAGWVPGLSHEGFGFPHVSWRGDRPLFVRQMGQSLESFDPLAPGADRRRVHAQSRPPLERFELLGVRPEDGRLVITGADGLFAVDPPLPSWCSPGARPMERLLEWPKAGPLSGALAPSGKRLLLSGRTGPCCLELLDLERGRVLVPLEVGRVDRVALYATSFSPDERRVAIALDREVAFFDTATGKKLGSLDRPKAKVDDGLLDELPRVAATWSPDGRLVASYSNVVLDLETGKIQTLASPVGAFPTGDRALLFRSPLAIASLATGEITLRPFEGR